MPSAFRIPVAATSSLRARCKVRRHGDPANLNLQRVTPVRRSIPAAQLHVSFHFSCVAGN